MGPVCCGSASRAVPEQFDNKSQTDDVVYDDKHKKETEAWYKRLACWGTEEEVKNIQDPN